MAYASGTYSSQDDLMSKLYTFAVTTGDATWTGDDLDTSDNEMAIHKGNVYVQFKWDETHIHVFQSTGWDGSGPGAEPGDSGNGDHSLTNHRKVEAIGNGSGAYWFFSNASGGSESYIHCVVRFTSDQYRHFGFGNLVKVGDWTGGAYAYGHTWDQGASNIDLPNSSAHSVLLDTVGNQTYELATIRMEGFQGEPSPSSKWGIIGNQATAGNDSDAVGRTSCFGGSRGGPYVSSWGGFAPSALTGAIPGCPVCVVYRNFTPSPDRWFFMGYQPDVRMGNIKNFAPEAEITVGSDTWAVFPIVKKAWGGLSADVEQSGNGGVFYKKNTT